MRQVVLDTETTGLEPARGHRVVEIGAVEIIDRRPTGERFHRYINPQRDIDDAAAEVHGLTLARLQDAPKFEEIAEDFLAFVRDAELIIHNAPFDVSFIDYELSLLDDATESIERLCKVTDSLALARHKHPGQQNNLDALCRRYGVDNSERELHGALLDAEILAEVYLLMTGGQASLFAADAPGQADPGEEAETLPARRPRLVVVSATEGERAAHEARLDALDDSCREGGSVWRRLAPVR